MFSLRSVVLNIISAEVRSKTLSSRVYLTAEPLAGSRDERVDVSRCLL